MGPTISYIVKPNTQNFIATFPIGTSEDVGTNEDVPSARRFSTGQTSATIETNGLTYLRAGEADETVITPVGGTLGTWVSGGIVEVESNQGVYQFGVPNAVLAQGVAYADVFMKFADADTCVDVWMHFDLIRSVAY
jgi:hypothetical protein